MEIDINDSTAVNLFCLRLVTDIEPELKNSDEWSFNILDKNSASSSLLITTHVGDRDPGDCPRTEPDMRDESFAIKTWCRPQPDGHNIRNPTSEELALGYEKRVYINKIKPILDANPDSANLGPNEYGYMPLLKYLGDDNNCCTVEVLAKFIGIEDTDDVIQKKFLYLVFYVMDAMVRDRELEELIKPINYKDISLYRRFFQTLTHQQKGRFVRKFHNDNDIAKWYIGAIILPNIRFMKYSKYFGMPQQAPLFRQLIKVLYTVNKANLVHNDIHPGNIMIKQGTPANPPIYRVMIYDWDRAYSPSLGNNPMLNSDTGSYPCKSSQCNIFRGQRPIDLLKILRYLADERNNLYDILHNSLMLNNHIIDGVPRFERIYDGIITCSPSKFYVYYNLSSLYTIGFCGPLEQAIGLLGGTWEIIYRNVFPEVEIDVGQANAGAVGMAIRKKKVSTEVIPVINIFMNIINQAFGEKIFTRDISNVEVSEELQSFANLYKTKSYSNSSRGSIFGLNRPVSEKYLKDMSEQKTYMDPKSSSDSIMSPKSSSDSIADLKSHTNLPISIREMSHKSASELTWTEFNELRRQVDIIKFGPPIPFQAVHRRTRRQPKETRFSKILQENENRKLEMIGDDK
jgi:hypothetical protein